jgi:Cytochrome c554 and c-prime
MITYLKFLMTVLVIVHATMASGAAVLPQYSHDKTLGVASCASSLCHGAIETWRSSNVFQNEYVTWQRSDKHARAYTVLLNDKSKEIAKKLALPKPAHESDVCLDCHTHNPKPAQRTQGFQIADGIACEACHGPAERWVRSHVEPGVSHANNLSRGMYPTEDDVSRARLCLSCHLGTKDKFVTHKIMSAGHPRMSFELDTFTQIGPAHFRIDADWQRRKGSWNEVRAWAIGQAVAAQELLSLLQGPRGRDGLFPELVLFDCHSCHHPMGDVRNTAARVGAGPGIVRLNDANLLMLRQISRRVTPADAAVFAQHVARLHQSVASGADALTQAGVVEKLIAGMIPKISAYKFTGEDLKAVMLGLIDDGLAGLYTDYQGAEQAVMAVQSVADFMGRQNLLNTQPLKPTMRRLLATVAHDEKYQPAAFTKVLRELKTSVETGVGK